MCKPEKGRGGIRRRFLRRNQLEEFWWKFEESEALLGGCMGEEDILGGLSGHFLSLFCLLWRELDS